jgi:phosphatidylglycerol:prolipoprotein diacylglycerol transferase
MYYYAMLETLTFPFFGIPIVLYPYNILIILGFAVAFIILKRDTKIYSNHSAEYFISAIPFLFVVSIFSSFVVYNTLHYSVNKRITIGFVYYGWLLSFVILTILIDRIKHKTYFFGLNLSAAPVAIAQAFGRMGCYLGGCCFGYPTNSSFGVIFPYNSIPFKYYRNFHPIHPVQLYEMTGLILIFIMLRFIDIKCRFASYCIFYGVLRFICEYFRNDYRGSVTLFSLSFSQLISLCIICFGLIYMAYYKRLLIFKQVNNVSE